MRELILIFSYVICAFVPVLLMRRYGQLSSQRSFWGTWFFSLTGAFAGGFFGTVVLARIGVDFSFFAGIVPALLGASFVTILLIMLRRMPENW